MAGYRPKSLDELNNLYGKSVEAKNEIKKSERIIEKREETETGFMPEPSAEGASSREPNSPQSAISDFADSFVKSFADEPKPEPAKPQPLSISVQSRPRPVKGSQNPGRPAAKKSFELESDKKSEEKSGKNEKNGEEKPRLIRNSERSDLFESYKKIMDDEDDGSYSPIVKHQKRKAKKPKHEKPAPEQLPQEPLEPEFPAEDKAQQKPEEKPEETILSDDVFDIDKQKQNFEASLSEENVEENEYIDQEAADDEEFEDTPQGTVGRIILMTVLLIALLSASAVGMLESIFTVNTGELIFNKYRIFTADNSYVGGYIEKGNLIITLEKEIEPGQIFAYKKSEDNTFGYAKLQKIINSEGSIAENDGDELLVFRNEKMGVIAKNIPVIGTVVALISANSLPVLAVLLLLILIISVILILSFKGKLSSEKKNVFNDEDDNLEDGQEDEDYDEYDSYNEDEEDYGEDENEE